VAVIITFVYDFHALSVTPISEQAGWKSPLEYQLVKENTVFAQAAGKYIEHSKLLVPTWTAGCELALLFPEMKEVAPRLVTHYFTNAGNPDEGLLGSPGLSLPRALADSAINFLQNFSQTVAKFPGRIVFLKFPHITDPPDVVTDSVRLRIVPG
jgi:hypothetical protein